MYDTSPPTEPPPARTPRSLGQPIPWKRLTRLGSHSVASIVDQGAAAASNFVSAVFIGRLAGAEALGVFAITGVMVMALRQLQGGAVLEPMSVFGPRRPADERGPYLGFLLGLEVISIGGASLLIALGSLGAWGLAKIDQAETMAIIASLVFANLLILQILIRRQYYVDHLPYAALIQSLGYLALSTAGMLLYAMVANVSVAGTYFVMALASLAVCSIRSVRYRRLIRMPSRPEVRKFLHDHWTMGRWILLSVPVTIAFYQGYFVLVGSLLSLEDAGRLKAVDSLVAPFQQVVVGLSMLLVPMFSRQYDTMTGAQRNRFTALALAGMIGLSMSYSGILFFFGPALLHLAYGSKLAGSEAAIQIMAFVPVCLGSAQPATIRLLVARRTLLRFIVICIAAGATFAAGIPLILHGNLIGAASGMLVSQAVCSIGLWVAVFWLAAQERSALTT